MRSVPCGYLHCDPLNPPDIVSHLPENFRGSIIPMPPTAILIRNAESVEDFCNRKTANAKSAVLKNAIKRFSVLQFFNGFARLIFTFAFPFCE